MQRRRRDDVSSVCAEIDTLRQPNLVADESSRVREVEMAATATGPGFHRRGQAAALAPTPLDGDIAAMPHITFKYTQAGDCTRHDSDASIRVCAKPVACLRLACAPMLKLIPPDERSLVTRPDRDD